MTIYMGGQFFGPFEAPTPKDFSGSQGLSRFSPQSGAPTAAQQGTISTWFRADQAPVSAHHLVGFQNTSNAFGITRFAYASTPPTLPHYLIVEIAEPDRTILIDANSGNLGTLVGPWRHVLLTWDLATAAVNMTLDGSPLGLTINVKPAWTPASTMTFAGPIRVAHAMTPSPWDGCMAQFWMDATIVSDVTKFRNPSTGKPVYLGATGERPTGSPPIIFMPTVNGTNNGTGGNLSVVNGPLADCSNAP